jgi:hypothetical protein
MEYLYITAIRAKAEKCFHLAQMTDNRRAKLRLLALAEAWLLFSETIGKPEFDAEPQALRQPATRH